MSFFSIIVPTYNRAAFLPKAIDSVVSQFYEDWELIIVDDGSTDNTKEIVNKYKDSRILYVYQDNAERSAARNNGISHAKGEYILFLDSDDFLFSNFLQDLFVKIQEAGGQKALYFHNVICENKDQKRLGGKRLPSKQENIVCYLFENKSVIGVWQAAIPRSFLENNKFEERFSLWEDTHLFFRLLSQFPYIQTDVEGYCVVQHSTSTVAIGSRSVALTDVKRYISAINDLEYNYWNLFSTFVNHKLFQNYRDAKLNMYLYMARKNEQYSVMYKIAWLVLVNKKSLENLFTCLKLPICHLLKK